jgi:hypothetical protein
MSRILFAAAKGARIQVLYRRGWIPAVAVRIDGHYKYRIHPDDEHLQYGPISTELRAMAEQYVWSTRWENQLANGAAKVFIEFLDSRTGEPDYPLFYLFLAEFLADSGL